MRKAKKKAVKIRDLKPSKDAKGGIPPGPPIMPSRTPKMPQGPPN
jgi:hypothetical protein